MGFDKYLMENLSLMYITQIELILTDWWQIDHSSLDVVAMEICLVVRLMRCLVAERDVAVGAEISVTCSNYIHLRVL
jgi:hypothetical protein